VPLRVPHRAENPASRLVTVLPLVKGPIVAYVDRTGNAFRVALQVNREGCVSRVKVSPVAVSGEKANLLGLSSAPVIMYVSAGKPATIRQLIFARGRVSCQACVPQLRVSQANTISALDNHVRLIARSSSLVAVRECVRARRKRYVRDFDRPLADTSWLPCAPALIAAAGSLVATGRKEIRRAVVFALWLKATSIVSGSVPRSGQLEIIGAVVSAVVIS